MHAGALSAQEGMLGVTEIMSGWHTASVPLHPGYQKLCNHRTGILTGGEPANDLCQGAPACHGTKERYSHVKELRLSCHHPTQGDRTRMPGTGGGHCAALLERSTGSDTARIRHHPASACSRSGTGTWEDLTRAAIKERRSLHFVKQSHTCKRGSARRGLCARKAILKGLLTLHLA